MHVTDGSGSLGCLYAISVYGLPGELQCYQATEARISPANYLGKASMLNDPPSSASEKPTTLWQLWA